MDSVNLAGLRQVLSSFAIEGSIERIVPAGSGHINDSYQATISPGGEPGYLLQRINHLVFTDIPSLMQNIDRVTRHMREEILRDKFQNHPSLQFMQVLEIVPAWDGELYSVDRNGHFWRVYRYIPGSRSFDRLVSPTLALESGRAFGWFLSVTSGLDAGTLTETIPRFHDIAWRLEEFDAACVRNQASRVNEVQKEIDDVNNLRGEMLAFGEVASGEEIPRRVTHNDTKCNNILFNGNDRAIGIVDLDTVMPGTILFDFGDAIRTGASTANEDETDLSRVHMDIRLFEAYAGGFLETAGATLTPTEIDHLAFSAMFMTYIIGLRFLTDYINGDVYYKIHHPGHNLERAQNQFVLFHDMNRKLPEMQHTIHVLKPT